MEILKLSIPVLIAVLGWVAGHWFNSKRDRSQKRRELISRYLLDSYRSLENFSISLAGGVEASEALAAGTTSAISDIQLFGSEAQVKLAVEIADAIEKTGGVYHEALRKLVSSLREDLRAELGLEAVKIPIKHFVITYTKPNEKP